MGILLGGYDPKDEPLKHLHGLAGRLRAGYTLTFAVEPGARRHRLDVRVTTRGLEARAPMAFRATP